MAADFQNVYRYNVGLCSSVVLADVSEHNNNPAGENELRFMVGTMGRHDMNSDPGPLASENSD